MSISPFLNFHLRADEAWGGGGPREYQPPQTFSVELSGEKPGTIYVFENVFGFDYFTRTDLARDKTVRTTWIRPHNMTWHERFSRQQISHFVKYAQESSKDHIDDNQPMKVAGTIGHQLLMKLNPLFMPTPKLEDIQDAGKFAHDVLTIARIFSEPKMARYLLKKVNDTAQESPRPPLPTDQGDLIRYVLKVAQNEGFDAAARLTRQADSPIELASKMLEFVELKNGFPQTYERFSDKSPYFQQPLIPFCRNAARIYGSAPNPATDSPDLSVEGLEFLGACRDSSDEEESPSPMKRHKGEKK